MKKEFSANTTEVFTKTMFHYIPKMLEYINEITEPRKRVYYPKRYLILSEMLMFLSEGRSQRFTETAYTDTEYLENENKIIKEKITKVPDAEIYTNVFSRIKKEEIEELQYKINYQIYGSVKVFRRKFYAHLIEKTINIELIQIKIQIRFDKSTLTYINYTEER